MSLVWLKGLSASSPYPSPAGYWVSCRFCCHAALVVLPPSRSNKTNETYYVQGFDNFVQKKCQLPFGMAEGPSSLILGMLRFWKRKPKTWKFKAGTGCLPAQPIWVWYRCPQCSLCGGVGQVLHACGVIRHAVIAPALWNDGCCCAVAVRLCQRIIYTGEASGLLSLLESQDCLI